MCQPIIAQVKKNSFLIQNSTLFQKVVYLINSKNQSIHSSCVKLMICCGNLPVLARFCSRVKQNSRDVGRSKNFGEGVVIGRHNLPPSWDRVNWYAKIWGMRAPPLPPIPTALNRTVTSINAPRALTFEVLQKWKWTWVDLGHNLFCCKGMCIVQKKSPCPGLYTLLTYTSQFLPPLNQFLAPHVSVPTLSFNMAYKKIGY